MESEKRTSLGLMTERLCPGFEIVPKIHFASAFELLLVPFFAVFVSKCRCIRTLLAPSFDCGTSETGLECPPFLHCPDTLCT